MKYRASYFVTIFTLKIQSLIDNKHKKWALTAIFFSLILALDDFSVATLEIPNFNQLNITQGVVKVKQGYSGGRFGAGSKAPFYLKVDSELIKFNCRVSTRQDKSCISRNDANIYQGKRAVAWWYKETVFGPLKENRLLQLEVDGRKVIDYEQQKARYKQLKKSHDYLFIATLVLSLIWFFLLQLRACPSSVKKGK